MFTGPAGDSAARLLASFWKGSSFAEAKEKDEGRSMKEEIKVRRMMEEGRSGWCGDGFIVIRELIGFWLMSPIGDSRKSLAFRRREDRKRQGR
jgi:hypothetical protein